MMTNGQTQKSDIYFNANTMTIHSINKTNSKHLLKPVWNISKLHRVTMCLVLFFSNIVTSTLPDCYTVCIYWVWRKNEMLNCVWHHVTYFITFFNWLLSDIFICCLLVQKFFLTKKQTKKTIRCRTVIRHLWCWSVFKIYILHVQIEAQYLIQNTISNI